MRAKKEVGSWLYGRWDIIFIVLANTWLFAPYFNHKLSRVSTLISEYEAMGRPFSTAFRLADLLAASMLIAGGWIILKRRSLPRMLAYALLLIGVGMALDSLSPITCRSASLQCLKDPSLLAWVHRTESMLTALALFYGSYLFYVFKRSLASMAFIVAQIAYGALLLALTLVYHSPPSTLAQFAYQFIVSLGLAMMLKCGLARQPRAHTYSVKRPISYLVGILGTVVVSTATLQTRLLHIRRVAPYFRGHSVWVSNYSIVVGLGLLFLAVKLLKGEARSRILTLTLLFLNSLYFSVIRPQPLILIMSLVLFLALYVSIDEFDRSTYIPKTFDRLKQVGTTVFMTAIILTSIVIISALFQLNKKPRRVDSPDTISIGRIEVFEVTVPKNLLTVFTATSGLLIMWSLFRPAKPLFEDDTYKNAEAALQKYSSSSEDYFKLWPPERKNYFWGYGGFICYSVIGSVAFALADPICSTTNRSRLLMRFKQFCRSSGWTTCFLSVNTTMLKLYEGIGLKSVAIGSSAVININEFTATTLREKWWRWQMNRANKQEYTYVYSVGSHSAELLTRCSAVSDAWLGRSGRKERGFAMGYFDETYLQTCRIHYLVDKTGRVIAFANQIPVFGQKTATIDLMRFFPDAEGAMPVLLAEIIRALSMNEAYSHFDLGLVPFAGLDSRTAKIAQRLLGNRFSSTGLAQFKGKFNPSWQKIYIAYDGSTLDLPVVARNLDKVMDL